MRTLITVVFAFYAHWASSAEIEWKQWTSSAFKSAQVNNKLILINVGLEGCTACDRMAKYTYTDEKVREIINDNFIAIEVDSQARPDIGERYSDWAWPATIVLKPDTKQVFAMAGNRFPQNFIPILVDLVEKHKTNELTVSNNSPYSYLQSPITTPLTQLRDRLREQIFNQFNSDFSGWNNWGLNAEVDGARLRHLYFLAHRNNDDKLLQQAISVTDGFFDVLDPVWGGAYEASIHPNAEEVPAEFSKLLVIPEKRISSQANSLEAFATAYKLTGKHKYIEGIENVDRYLSEWMSSSDGTWFANQKDTAPLLPNNWWPQDYWALTTDEERRKYGIPPIDHAVYTDKNAEIISSYVKVYDALGDKKYLDKAEKAAKYLIKHRQTKAGWVKQSSETSLIKNDKRIRKLDVVEKPFLATQARMGTALLALYQHTMDKSWLHTADEIAKAMLTTLYDKDIGGFWSIADESNPLGKRKPLENNAIAGLFFYQLAVLTKKEEYKAIAEKAVKAVASEEVIAREGKFTAETLLLLENLTAEYVEFTVVTNDIHSQAAQALYKEGLNSYLPRKVIHFELPGRYPDLRRPAMFICNPNRCSVPLTRVQQISKVVEQYR